MKIWGDVMADLVIVAADLEVLQTGLKCALTDLETAHRALGAMDSAAVGAKPLISACAEVTRTRVGDVADAGRGLAALADTAARVKSTMGEVDEMLGGQARTSD